MKKTRDLSEEIEIHASIEDVWKALTDAEELTRWFPLEAKVRSGVGGTIWMSWRNEYQFEWKINKWKPNQHLRSVYEQPGDSKTGPGDRPSQPMIVDYHLSSRGDKTVLRLVQSGFSADTEWDELFDATHRGWQTCLWVLQQYLEHHRGTPRDMVYIRYFINHLSRDEAWRRLLSGFDGRKMWDKESPGGSYRLCVADSLFEGTIKSYIPPIDFVGTVENLNHSLLRIHIDQLSGRRDISFELCTYGLPADEVQHIRNTWSQSLKTLLEN
jgi:uncharacterized protein YndB with AHSA1/START domain